ncbi:hypothetical protein PENARI_c027G02139 [Penicillium arizonense]|uniref:Uncharacterized protein n=1 Tax=Penicillium arizonense TaxID=1835702 RepID=A0A1F5L6S5_PENAI|nr:hypothetical protein PENARI_c027G02139 [Penicillium arizonense]OGE48611.1 hypothetical protein PENARI_c027G02139 [Penicillium arizonense]
MADPLSIASGIAGLLSLGIQVTQSLANFYIAYKDQDNNLAKITQNLKNIQGIFRCLHVAVQDHRSKADAQEILKEAGQATHKCEEIIKELDMECRKIQKDLAPGFKGRIQVAGRRAAYPFRKSTLQKLEEDIGEIRANLSFALDVLQLKCHDQIQDDILELKTLLERTNASQVSSTIRAWLMAPDASLNHNAACAKRHQDTGLCFRYVECQFNAIRRARNRNQLDECLRALPRDLDETYERVLCSIDKEYIDDVRRVLTVLCFSARPLTVNELIEAHAVDLNEPPHLDRDGRSYGQDDLADICLGLIEFAATEDDNGQNSLIARIAHFSVQEYLQSDRILQQNSRRFAMRSAPANTELAHICLVYLLEPGFSVEVLSKRKLKEYPLAQYAAGHWFHHYAISEEGKPRIEKLVVRLFTGKIKPFATWIRLHDMDRPWNKKVDYDRPATDIASPLYYAARLGLESVLKSILATGTEGLSVSVNAQGGRLSNALQAASINGHEKVVQILLDQGADVNVQAGDYGSALQAASSGGHEKVVQMLLDRGADINAQGGHFDNALQAASTNGHGKVVQMLLDRGADVNAEGGDYGYALQAASSGGHESVVQILLDRGADVNASGGHFGDALQAASSGGHERVVQMLLDRGADVGVQRGQYGNAVQAASFGGHEQVVQMLLDRGADVNAHSGVFGYALQSASSGGHGKTVEILLDRGADIDAQGGQYGNALQAASCSGHEKVVQVLLERGADMNVQGGHFDNALYAASINGHDKVVQILLNQGADANAQGGFFGNAFQAASFNGHDKVVQMLLERGVDANAQGGYFEDAFHAASFNGHSG